MHVIQCTGTPYHFVVLDPEKSASVVSQTVKPDWEGEM